MDPGSGCLVGSRVSVVWLDPGTEHASLPRLSVSLLCRGNSRHWELSTGGGAATKIGISPPTPPPPHANNPVLYPRLSMRAKLVISYANGGAGSFRGKVCLKSGAAMFLPTGDISCSKYFDLASLPSVFIVSRQNVFCSPLIVSCSKSDFVHRINI